VPRRRAALAALTALLGLGLAAPGAVARAQAEGDPGIPGLPPLPTAPGMPIPAWPSDALLPQFLGTPATARPVRHRKVPQLPMLAPNGASSMHDDAYASDAYEVSGPLGRDLRVSTASYGVRECATIAFDSHGRIVGLCGGLEGFGLMVIDPVTLQPVSELQTSQRDVTSGKNPLNDICGGTYFFLDKHDRAYPTTVDKQVWKVAVHADGSLEKQHAWSVADVVPQDDCLIATMPDWKGRIWFFSQQGVVGTLSPRTGKVRTTHLPAGEQVTNSVSTDETGGVYVVSTHALYRLDARRRGRAAGTPRITWRQTYDRGSRTKPGNLSQGSGTTPTLIGKRWVAINDNADPRTQVVVYDRRRHVRADRRQHCAVPVLAKDAGTTENSLVSAGRLLVIENNYGYGGPTTTQGGKTSTAGLAAVKVGKHGCSVAWTSDETAPTSVAKASLGNGLLYAYTKPPRQDGQDAWYVTAIDLRTGHTRWSRLTGTGTQWNNHYASIYLGPDGTLYVATLAGLVRMEDGP
jgi:hypothetical protein